LKRPSIVNIINFIRQGRANKNFRMFPRKFLYALALGRITLDMKAA
jgi:hypothetical protein